MIKTNASWDGASPVLSILSPFFHDDPRPLLSALDVQARSVGGRVELLVVDDGSRDETLAVAVAAHLDGLATPACFVRFLGNQGRAAARNTLGSRARGQFLLFLDSDVLPGSQTFLETYFAAMDAAEVAVIVGGFTMGHSPEPDRALHQYMSQTFNCLSAADRQATAWKYTYSANLMVPAEVFAVAPFDPGYAGWGWEDLEWGLRIADHWPIFHIDNTVIHEGLDPDHLLLGKIAQSCVNFARVASAHPTGIRTYECYRVARQIRGLPAREAMANMAKWLALAQAAPLPVRGLAVRVYRALIYSLALY